MRRSITIPGGLLALSLLAGCRLSVPTPDGFLTLERKRHEFKAVANDQAKVWVREFLYPKGGDLAFWSGVLKEELKATPGYTLLEEREVKDDWALEGRELVFRVGMQGKLHRYMVRVYLVPRSWRPFRKKHIRVAQFLASDEAFDRHVEGIRLTFGKIRP